jgi:hypothetical protein
VPEHTPFELLAPAGGAARLLWLKRRYEPFAELDPPPAVVGRREEVAMVDLPVPGVARQELLDAEDPTATSR